MLADPCTSLFTQADAARAAALPITHVKSTPAGSGATCTYETGRPGHSVLVTVYRTSSPQEAAVTFDQDIAASSHVYVQPPVTIPHLGDGAKAFGRVLWVRRGSVIFVINVTDVAARGATLERAETLARAAIARIAPRGT